MNKEENKLEKALKNFEERFGVSYEEVTKSKEAQNKVRMVLDKETIRLREKYL